MGQTLLDTPSSQTNGKATAPLPSSLSEIRAPVEEDLKEFRRYFRSAMRSDVRLLDRVVQYVLRQKGKQLRPILVLLAARVCGEVSERTYRGAALVELLHSATLIHDDVVDEADKRRGLFSINALWKNKIAVLFGDFLLSRGLLLALKHDDYELLHTMSDAVRRMSEGELLQIEKARRLDLDEETYFRIISDKTASLISACTVSGAVSVDADPDDVQRMRTFGEKLGLAFQIRDDLFDFGGSRTGKPVGIDLKEKKMTLPVIHALGQADRSERRRIVSIFRKDHKSGRELEYVTDFVHRLGGIEYALKTMRTLADEARAIAQAYPASDAQRSLVGLVDYTVNRSR
ncbi:MAG: polyprenyl synthetase family protein [Rhodothermales bacterium]|nr:polyprenyl synthetase family protein [Rhodothermales bacterium]